MYILRNDNGYYVANSAGERLSPYMTQLEAKFWWEEHNG